MKVPRFEAEIPELTVRRVAVAGIPAWNGFPENGGGSQIRLLELDAHGSRYAICSLDLDREIRVSAGLCELGGLGQVPPQGCAKRELVLAQERRGPRWLQRVWSALGIRTGLSQTNSSPT
ncbi:unnamed protein product [Phytophthora lilii]|uniref:Unnamed protein product n=1 Tax=Phytophthora lilii TaxID=2077276 RepID=A0A9W6WPI1_9STRA|nr:unnamed protein product [Phytophthora lilii]